MSNVECQRFFAFSKRVPKDVKRFCGICRQHGKLEETRGHICEFKDCECQKCSLVRSRRLVMSQQIRLRRAQDKRFLRTTEPEEADLVPILSNATEQQQQQQELAPGLVDAKNMCYFCQKCKNHGILVWKKQHKRQCPFTNCTCDFCELIETRRRLDQHIKRRKSEPQNGSENGGGDKSEGEESIPRKKSTASLPAQIEAMSMAAGTSSLWRCSPPGGLSLPIGIAQNRIAEHQEEQAQTPLDALAAQIMRIQQNSPEQQQSQSCSSSSLNGEESVPHSPPPVLAPMLASSDQQLLDQLLLSSSGLPLHGLPLGSDLCSLLSASSASSALPATLLPMASPSTSPVLAAANQLGQAPANAFNEALFNQMVMQCLGSGMASLQLPEAKMAEAQTAGAVDPQREMLLQVIGQLLQEQQHAEQQQAVQQQQQQQQNNLMEAALAMAGGANGAFQGQVDLHSLQQLATLQSAGLDPSLLATSLLMTQQQGLLKEVPLMPTLPNEAGNGGTQSPVKQELAQSQAHQSAFTLLRPGFGLP